MTAQPQWLSPQQQDIWRTWLHAHTTLTSALSRQLSKESGLTLAEYEVLVHLSEHDEQRMRMAALAQVMQWDRSRLSHQITRMSKRGLVRRAECPEDGRGAFVELEPAGLHTIQDAAPGHVHQVTHSFFHALTDGEMAQLGTLLSKIDAHLTPKKL